MITKIIFLIVLFLANAIQAITGFAGTVLAMPPSIYLIGLNNAKVVLNAMAWISGLLIAVKSYRHINYRELIKMILLMFVGMVIGMKIYEILPSDILLRIYGIVILAIALKNLLFPKSVTLRGAVLMAILIIAGIIHGMFVSGGALLVVYAAIVLKDKDEFRATVAPIWVILNTYMMAVYLSKGLVTEESVNLIILSIIPLLAATYIGSCLQKKMKQETFLKLTYILLIISGLSLII